MTYQQTLDYLYGMLPMYQRVGAIAFKKDLSNTIRLCGFLNNPHKKIRTVHIAGTNGKGSVSHIIASVLAEAGYKTGLYTSPHLTNFRERIKINGEFISEEEVVKFVEKSQPAIESIQPSFFEMTVAMAFDHFAKQKTDIAVIETGLGGRLDSTNVINPEISVITGIAYDHQFFLGDTLEKIATEKAGIIKENKTVIAGYTSENILEVFKKTAKSKNAPFYFAPEHFKVKFNPISNGQCLFSIYHDNELKFPDLDIGLYGHYQTNNIATALQSIEILRKGNFQISDHAIHQGLINLRKNTGLSGRWDILRENPLVVCDIAHNPDAVKKVIDQILSLNKEQVHIVFGTVSDKDLDSITVLLPKTAQYYYCKPDVPRGMETDILYSKATQAGLKGTKYDSVTEAFDAAVKNASENDCVLVCGSAFVVAEVLYPETKKTAQ